MSPQFKPVIGLEIHAQLNTITKMFCDSLNNPDEKRPNFNICPICISHPGTLPVINEAAVKKVILTGLALNCSIAHNTFFERKNYFYPDLPKGYQISQYQKPLCENGVLEITNSKSQTLKKINITRIHLEEDAGRLYHTKDGSLVDYNRAGVPLMELVTEPDFMSGEEVRAFAEEYQLILRYIDASDADMEKGLLRVEVNISLTNKDGSYGTKVEIKNLNSISAAAASVEYEIKRQTEILEKGEKVMAETRGWDDVKKVTFSQRSKEEAHDYRYFPEPDLPPLKIITKSEILNPKQIQNTNTEDSKPIFVLEDIRAMLPELPQQRRERFKKQYGLPDADVELFVVDRELGNYFEHIATELGEQSLKLAANYLITEIQKHGGVIDIKITPGNFADLIKHIANKEISSSGAQIVLEEMYKTGLSPEHIIKEKDLGQVSDTGALESIVDTVIASNPKPAEDYKKGKEASLKFLIGMAMRESKGKGNPQILEEIIKTKLK